MPKFFCRILPFLVECNSKIWESMGCDLWTRYCMGHRECPLQDWIFNSNYSLFYPRISKPLCCLLSLTILLCTLFSWACVVSLTASTHCTPNIKVLTDLQEQGMVKKGEQIALVQSGRQPIWRYQSTHNIQVRKV